MTDRTEEKFYDKKFSRRQMLKFTGAGAAGVAIGASGLGGVLKVFGMVEEEDNPKVKNKINFYGKHQSGIATECQSYVYFASLNVLVDSQHQQVTERVHRAQHIIKETFEAPVLNVPLIANEVKPISTGWNPWQGQGSQWESEESFHVDTP